MTEAVPNARGEERSQPAVDLFLSLNSRDRAAVEAVRAELERRGVTTFLDRANLAPGMPWVEVLDTAVGRARALAVFLGPSGLGTWQRREATLALDRQAHEDQRGRAFPVVPVLLPGAAPDEVPGFLRLNTWVDLRRGVDDPAGLDALVAAARGEGPPGSPTTTLGLPARTPDGRPEPSVTHGEDQRAISAAAVSDSVPRKPSRRGTAGTPRPRVRSDRTSPARWMLGTSGVLVVVAGVVAVRGITRSSVPAIYRVRATVVDSRDTPVDDARVWSDQGGEGKRVAGGWQFDIPSATAPAGRWLVVRAARETAFETAADSLRLGAEPNPTVTLHLRADTTASVRGSVVDAHGRAVAGATVAVAGYLREGTVTAADGGFVLPAHAAEGQQILLRAEKAGVGATTLNHPAGREPAILRLAHVEPAP